MALPILLTDTPPLRKDEFIPRMKAMQLAYIHREGHGQPIQDAEFRKNLLVTVGGNVLNIYDNDNDGHLDLFFHFENNPIEKSNVDGGDLTCVTFVGMPTIPEDVEIAFGGESGEIQVISVCQQSVVRLFKGHKSKVIDIACHNGMPIMVSAGQDKTIRVWNTSEKQESAPIVSVWNVPATPLFARIDPTGTFVIVVLSNSTILRYELDGSTEPSATYSMKHLQKFGAVDSLIFFPISGCGHLLISQKGRVSVVRLVGSQVEVDLTWKVDDSEGSIGLSPCGKFVCVGKIGGGFSVYSLTFEAGMTAVSKTFIAESVQSRVKVETKATFFSPDMRNVVCIGGIGTIWRFDHTQ